MTVINKIIVLLCFGCLKDAEDDDDTVIHFKTIFGRVNLLKIGSFGFIKWSF